MCIIPDMVNEVNRRQFLQGLGGIALMGALNPSKALAKGAAFSEKFVDEGAKRAKNLEDYLNEKEFSSVLDESVNTYNIPKELVLSIVGVEGGTPWIGATKNPYFKDTFGTGIVHSPLNKSIRRVGAVGIPQMFDPAFIEAVGFAKGDNSLIKESNFRLEEIPLSEYLTKDDTQIPTSAYQSELVASYLSRLADWMYKGTRGNELSPEQTIVLSQAYNAGAPSLINNANLQNREEVGSLAKRLLSSPEEVRYGVNGVDNYFAKKVSGITKEIS